VRTVRHTVVNGLTDRLNSAFSRIGRTLLGHPSPPPGAAEGGGNSTDRFGTAGG
jgi:hypothetical protein